MQGNDREEGMTNESDIELLRLAAKAAGLAPIEDERWEDGRRRLFLLEEGREWNPLADDGDALRLAVKLGLEIRPDSDSKTVTAAAAGAWEEMPWDGDATAATRRAIVRAAAEIGRAQR